MRKFLFIGLMLAVCSGAVNADVFDDDIYYNPKKDNRNKVEKKKSQYIENFADLDVDTYNRRGQYYVSPIDTIGRGVENEEDFVYTQQIQKYYNPTIVVDNADVLADLLANSYGNVDIVIENGYPMFSSWSYSWPYWGSPWSWRYSNWGWGWGPSWYDPWYAWGPSWNWGWGPSWSWGWGPSWGWDWGWGPSWSWGPGWGWGGGGHYAHYRPGGNRPVNPGSGWAGNTRPGGNYNGGVPGYHGNGISASRPGMSGSNSSNPTSRPGNYHRGGYTNSSGLHGMRPNNSGNYGNSSNNGYRFNSGGHRVTGNSSYGGSNNNNNSGYHRSNSNRNNNYNYNNNSTNRRSNSYNSGSYNSGSHRSSGGSYRGGGGGGGRGRHR